MKSLIVCAAILWAVSSWAEPRLIYPWAESPSGPRAGCLDVPCVPCVFSVPGLMSSRPACPVGTPRGDEHSAPVALFGGVRSPGAQALAPVGPVPTAE